MLSGGVLVTGAAQIDANVISLRLLFTDTNYLIDNYQREYAWSQDDVQILIDDLWEGFEGHNGRPAETFFLGPFVYVQHDQTSRWLVDGQQRFTTLHLISSWNLPASSSLGCQDADCGAIMIFPFVDTRTTRSRSLPGTLDLNTRPADEGTLPGGNREDLHGVRQAPDAALPVTRAAWGQSLMMRS
jgi:Protein of unknown function DUF262